MDWYLYIIKRTECHTIQEGLALWDPDSFNSFLEHEKVQMVLDGICVNHLDATMEIIQADAAFKNGFS